jgi:hypothetical protein
LVCSTDGFIIGLAPSTSPLPATSRRSRALGETFMLNTSVYETPKILASFEADVILAEAETTASIANCATK